MGHSNYSLVECSSDSLNVQKFNHDYDMQTFLPNSKQCINKETINYIFKVNEPCFMTKAQKRECRLFLILGGRTEPKMCFLIVYSHTLTQCQSTNQPTKQ